MRRIYFESLGYEEGSILGGTIPQMKHWRDFGSLSGFEILSIAVDP